MRIKTLSVEWQTAAQWIIKNCPISGVYLLLTTLIAIVAIETPWQLVDNFLIQGFLCGIFWILSLETLLKQKRWLFVIAVIAALIFFWVNHGYAFVHFIKVGQLSNYPKSHHWFQWIFTLTGTLLFLFLYSYHPDNQNVWDRVLHFVVVVGIYGFLLTLLIWGSIALALGAIDYFFIPDFSRLQPFIDRLYKHTFVITAITIAPCFVLYRLSQPSTYKANPFLRFLAKQLLPFFSWLYLTLLYLYLLPLFLQGQFPSNEVGRYVLIFGIYSLIMFFILSVYLQNAQSFFLLKGIPRVYFIAFLFPLISFYIALSIRIHHYGWSIARYYAALIGIYLTIIAGMLIIKNLRFHLSTFFIVAFLLWMFSLIGPWSAKSLSYRSQMYRLAQGLQTDFQSSDSAVSAITSIADYLMYMHREIDTQAIPLEYREYFQIQNGVLTGVNFPQWHFQRSTSRKYICQKAVTLPQKARKLWGMIRYYAYNTTKNTWETFTRGESVIHFKVQGAMLVLKDSQENNDTLDLKAITSLLFNNVPYDSIPAFIQGKRFGLAVEEIEATEEDSIVYLAGILIELEDDL